MRIYAMPNQAVVFTIIFSDRDVQNVQIHSK